MLPKYIFINPNKKSPEMGAGYILCTSPPFIYAKVIKATDRQTFKIDSIQMPGYLIYLVYAGSLTNLQAVKQVSETLNEMSAYFMEEKINNNLGYYKRYKI